MASHRREQREPFDLRAATRAFAGRRFPFRAPRLAPFFFFGLGGIVLIVSGLVRFVIKFDLTALEIIGVGLAFVVIAWAVFGIGPPLQADDVGEEGNAKGEDDSSSRV